MLRPLVVSMIRLALLLQLRLVSDLLASSLAREEDMCVAGTVTSMREMRSLVRTSQVDVALIMIDSDEPAPLELVKELSVGPNAPRVLALCLCSHNVFAVRAMRAGAMGFVNAHCRLDEIIEAVRLVAGGKRHIASNSLDDVVAGLLWEDGDAHAALTDREFEVLLLIAGGRTPAEIAEALHLSMSTVTAHRRRMLEKLNLHSTAEAVRYALRNKLIT